MIRRLAASLLISTLGCNHSVIAQRPAPGGYPTGEDAAVYRAALDAIFTSPQKFVVLADRTVSWGTAAESRARWRAREKARGSVFDAGLVNAFVVANAKAVAIDPNFGYRVPVRLLSDSLRKVFEARGQILVDAARRNHSSGVDFMPFWTGFYDAFPGAHGDVLFSKPGFNQDFTRAILEFAQGCGSLCGESGYLTLEKAAGRWRVTDKVVEMVS